MNESIQLFLALGAAVVYFFVGLRLGSREHTTRADGRAWSAFRMWWLLLATNTVVTPLSALLASIGIMSLGVHLGLSLLGILLLSVALWGLLYYLIYIYTGQENLRWWLALVYGIFFIGLLYYTWQRRPLSVAFSDRMALIVYQNEASTLFTLALLILLVLPTILASLALLSLYFRVDDRSQRFRLIVVSMALLIWFGSALVAFLTPLSTLAWWPVFSQVLGLVAALSIFLAYFPPGFIRSQFNVSRFA